MVSHHSDQYRGEGFDYLTPPHNGKTAAISIASPEGVIGVRLWVMAPPFVGAALLDFAPVYRWVKG